MRPIPVGICLLITIVKFAKCQHSDEEKLKELQNNFREWRLSIVPQYATRLQDNRYNDKMDSYDFHKFDEIKTRVDDYLKQLYNIDKAKLTGTDKNDYDIFKDFLQTIENGYPWRMYTSLTPISNLEGPQLYLPKLVDITPFYTRGDYENYLVRMDSFPKQINNIIDRMTEAINRNHTSHNVSMDNIPEQIERIITTTPKQFALYSPFNETLENLTSIPQSVKTDLRNRASTSIEGVMSSFRKLKSFMETQYFRHLRQEYGVNSWMKGDQFYRACLNWYLSFNMSPKDVHQKGLDEVERIYKEMEKV